MLTVVWVHALSSCRIRLFYGLPVFCIKNNAYKSIACVVVFAGVEMSDLIG